MSDNTHSKIRASDLLKHKCHILTLQLQYKKQVKIDLAIRENAALRCRKLIWENTEPRREDQGSDVYYYTSKNPPASAASACNAFSASVTFRPAWEATSPTVTLPPRASIARMVLSRTNGGKESV